MSTIAFIGLGNMGGPMAENLLAAGLKVQVFDLMPEAVKKLESAGAVAAPTVEDAVKGADTVVTMLPAGEHVRAVYLGDHSGGVGLLNMVEDGTFLIDSSTIDPQSARIVAQCAADKGLDFVDAPVSGGVAGAKAGTLTFIVGGSDGAFEKAESVLKHMGKNIFHAGKAGDGQMGKICNNLMLGILMSGTCEALNLGIDNGLDPKVLSNIMLQSSGRNWALELYNPCPGVMETAPASNEFKPGFMSKLMLKDLGLGLDAAAQSQSSVPMGSLARNLYAFHNANGNEELDFSSLFEFYQSKK
ncbi:MULTISPECIES: 3-hydroxyisobutyrate dehydrogenase [Vibrio]|uniref:3-hydroxyisobutyrate dehydrogenase n=1 Tax=Vibrio coralliilyticus TaxID=190893 RepID=A0AAP6ZP66_9VIBR|nr:MULTISPECIES: 3-hydroxyisobutyrate dehydrogenase [Vibrio]AXN33196.1 3-hydroxyisobutyrate dehydrogenase [Vibrio coralliilyticus]EEX33428.1 3-hydroxyisobutyrate dehydrogenase [Vibrio coralliilyticus ATCC BAA-450]KPH23684.1 3-hydroxyisobutyrate dehydrogenase [Vibrio coralliilyticus]MCM5508324.1 3-hydroxyisobutyrate dehydrogenase [Vibrio sp. SCSIO 43169]MDE3897030.1 3-hydroxyisobutyrate dehydrogenase [Vibrio sp. CC007]